MKNQQIHQQEKKISDLEKVVGSNKLGQTGKGARAHTSCVPNRVRNYGALISARALLSQIVHCRLDLVTMFVFFNPVVLFVFDPFFFTNKPKVDVAFRTHFWIVFCV